MSEKTDRITHDMLTKQPCALAAELKDTPFSEQLDMLRQIAQGQSKSDTHIAVSAGVSGLALKDQVYYEARLNETGAQPTDDIFRYQTTYDVNTGKVTVNATGTKDRVCPESKSW